MLHNLASYARSLARNCGITYVQILGLAVVSQEVHRVDRRKHHLDLDINLENSMDSATGLLQTLPRPDHAFWSALAAFSVSEWLTRVWTFQEIQLASKATLLAGDLHVDWNMVRWSTFRLLKAYTVGGLQAQICFKSGMVVPTRREMLLLNRSFSHWLQFFRDRQDPTGCLKASGTRISTLLKDHVYGVLGLWAEKCNEAITIDYKITDAEVFAGAVKACLRYKSSTINTFWSVYYDLANIHSPIPGIPSWCPDLRFALQLDTHVPAVLGTDASKKYLPYACYEEMPDLKQIGIKVLHLDYVARMVSRACPSEPVFEPGHRFTQESITWVIEMCNALDIRNNDALKEYLAIDQQEIESLYAAAFSDNNMRNTSRLKSWKCLNRHANKYVFQTAHLVGYDTLHGSRLMRLLSYWCRIATVYRCCLPMRPSTSGVHLFMAWRTMRCWTRRPS